ncbi:MAG: flagellin, partial [Synergistaceae bacterium]|nr:flagellin [Synergistaceae bacterium]MBR1418785.1 flagellin [Synergistaceae bacterium]
SLLQTAEGALTEVDSMLQRMRELATQAANDTLTGQDRAYIQAELDQLRDEIDRIGNTTRFNNKALLNGTAAALWSAIPKETQAIIKGSLKSIDQFGQKGAAEGNYNIKLLAAPPGEAEVQKTSVFKVKSEGVLKHTILDSDKVVSITSENLDPNSEYVINAGTRYTGVAGAISVANPNGLESFIPRGVLSYSGFVGSGEMSITVKDATPGEWYGSFSDSRNKSGSLTLQVKGFITRENGTVQEFDSERTFTATPAQGMGIQGYTQVFRLDGNQSWAIQDTSGNDTGLRLTMSNRNMAVSNQADGITSTVHEGDTAVWNMRTLGSANVGFTVSSDKDVIDNQHVYNFVGSQASAGNFALLSGKEIKFNQLNYDPQTKSVNQSSITIQFADDAEAMRFNNLQNAGDIAKIGAYKIGETAGSDVTLKDVDRFYDPDSGNFLLDEPQTIKITQGDGKTASVTLYAGDTLGDVAEKINNAIANDLGQAKYVDSSSKDKFATFVDSASDETSESVAGTLLIRSAVSGANGKLSFSGSEDMIKALGLNTIQEATESVYEAKVTDAHSGAEIKTATVTGNKLNGILHENVDVEFDGMAGVIRTWDSESKSYKYNASSYDTIVHLADNTLTLQMGISSNEDMFLSIGDMRSQALGIDKIHVMDREAAANALSVIDSAIDTVSTQRAKLGAYINRIEYNLDNMRIAENNMSSTESNIKDTDYAKEMINFTKLQITLQANNAMLAQANQTQERVLDLLR